MSTFQVKPADLLSLTRQMSSLLTELEQAGDVRALSVAVAENPQLESALEALLARWAQSLQAIQQSLFSMSERLAKAGTAYEETERTLTDKLLGEAS